MVAAAGASRSVRVDLVRGDMETPYLDGKAERRWDRSARVGRLLDVGQGAGEFVGCGSAGLVRDQRVAAGRLAPSKARSRDVRVCCQLIFGQLLEDVRSELTEKLIIYDRHPQAAYAAKARRDDEPARVRRR